MRYLHRLIEKELVKASRRFGAIILTGTRRAGKTTLLQKLYPDASYYLLEDPDIIVRVRSDPRTFIEEIKTPVILDEIQNTPELFSYIRSRVDGSPRRYGRWYLTGSQEASLMRHVTESMAGRAAMFQLLPLSFEESDQVTILKGGFPEVVEKRSVSEIWFRSYIQTYLERDVRLISAIRDLMTFRRFLSLVASRCGQILNKTELASVLGLSVPAITEWLNILEVTMQIILVPPFYENFGKRLIKSPKIYFMDSGLLCHLLGIMNEKMLMSSPFLGPVFECFIASELIKHQLGAGRRRELYFFRDQQGLEVDFLVPAGNRRLFLMEVKASRTARPQMADSLRRLKQSIKNYQTEGFLVQLPQRGVANLTSLASGVRVITVNDFGRLFGIRPRSR